MHILYILYRTYCSQLLSAFNIDNNGRIESINKVKKPFLIVRTQYISTFKKKKIDKVGKYSLNILLNDEVTLCQNPQIASVHIPPSSL